MDDHGAATPLQGPDPANHGDLAAALDQLCPLADGEHLDD